MELGSQCHSTPFRSKAVEDLAQHGTREGGSKGWEDI